MINGKELKWQKAGICKVSRSKKVILLAIYELDVKKWLIVDVDELFKLVAGRCFDVPIFESVS